MNFFKKLFKTSETEVEPKIEKKVEVKVEKKHVKFDGVSKKLQYREEKRIRQEKAKMARIEQEKLNVEKEKAKIEQAKVERERKIQERQQMLEAQKNDSNVIEDEKVYEKVDNSFELYGFKIDELSRKDEIQVEILGQERDRYFARSLSNFQDVVFLKIEANEEFSVGDVVNVIVFKYYADEYYVSQRRFENKVKLKEQLSNVKMDEIVTGKVIMYKKPNFIIETTSNLKAKCFIRNMDTKYIDEPDKYLDKTFEFIIQEKIEDNHSFQLELNRRDLLIKSQKEIASNIAIDQIINISDFVANKGGLEFSYNNLRGFVPLKEISYDFNKDSTEALEKLSLPTDVQIIEIQKKNNFVNLVGSIKKTTIDPWTNFIQNNHIGDQITGKISRIENYGIFVEVDERYSGLLHSSKYTTEFAAQLKQMKLKQEVTCFIESIDEGSKKVSLTLNIEEKEIG